MSLDGLEDLWRDTFTSIGTITTSNTTNDTWNGDGTQRMLDNESEEDELSKPGKRQVEL